MSTYGSKESMQDTQGEQCCRCGLTFWPDQLVLIACEGVFCRRCAEIVETGPYVEEANDADIPQ